MSKTKRRHCVFLDKQPYGTDCRHPEWTGNLTGTSTCSLRVQFRDYGQTMDITGVHSTDITEVPSVHPTDITGVHIGDGDGQGTLATRALVSGPRRKDMERVASETMDITDVHSPDITSVPIGDGDGHGTLATRVLVSGPHCKDMEKVATMDIPDVQTMDITGVHSTDITDVPTVHTPDITGVPIGDGDELATRALLSGPRRKDMERMASKTMDICDVHSLARHPLHSRHHPIGDGDGHGKDMERVYSVSVRLAHLHIG
ncbi:hypothetical protein NHX12_004579 [Muraenolepis orangiensis]|uniref:Uncharacterized protein n=1 Tax=Muraenolepis orangiensis TaxID=630683 RepID=A0A9Q0DUQ4_9TELE|nr:hypothetical protein NHX12_004579 [Muraenolepis orangiensis]